MMTTQNIAIIGIACRFPGAKNYHEFWNNLIQSINSIQEIPPERWDLDKHYSPNIDDPNKSISKWCGLLDNIDQFDNRFFSISPREAKQMDPQQRLLLEETWHCVEDSGVSLKILQEQKTAMYVGVMANDYQINATAPGIVTDSYAALGNYQNILANRLSYTFGLSGESLSINAACASSLVALHHAKIALQSGESDYAFVAGVNLNIQPWKYISFSKSRMLSPDGQCQTFDKDANGYVPGEGVGVLLLQPLDKALSAHNHIYGIIKGSAVNHGGKALSITAPRVEAQRNVILAAYQDAQITPEKITYVEAHGTGTSLGDPIEVEALTQAFREYTNTHHFCQIGSVKTNIGHLEAAAGIAGVIKVLLMMHHQKIPPTLNIKTLNPVINFEHSPFVVATQLQKWLPHRDDLPLLRAGVSSFGFGGVNSHILLESFSTVQNETAESKISGHLFVISAKSKNALKKTLAGWKDFIAREEYEKYRLIDISATLLTSRSHFPYRYGSYVKNKNELTTFLTESLPSMAKPNTHEWCLRVGEVVWENLADIQLLLEQEPFIKKHLNTVQQRLSALDINSDIKTGFQGTAWSPSLKPLYSFMVNYAYLSTLMELGLTPSLITGEKTGLWIALTLTGMVTIDDALAILAHQQTFTKPIQLTRPKVPFYDPVTDRKLWPYHFDEEYLHFLTDDLSLATADVHHFVERARLLKDCQFTFKKYLEEWGLILQKHTHLDLDSMLYNERLIQSVEDQSRQQQVLLMLIIKSSLRQLDKKWDLIRPKRITEPKFQELLDLIIDGVMPKETVVELFMEGEIPNMTRIATLLNERQNQLNPSKPYQFLNKHSQYLPVNATTQWFEKARASDPTVPVHPPLNYLEFGQLNQPSTSDSSIQITLTDKPDNAFQETLLKLWLKGVDIKWNLLYREGSFNKVPLPTYGFERSAFWLTQQKRSREPHLNDLSNPLQKNTRRAEESINIISQPDFTLKANKATVTHRPNESAITQEDKEGIEPNDQTKPLNLTPRANNMSRTASNSFPQPKIMLTNLKHPVKPETRQKGKPYKHQKVQLKSCHQETTSKQMINTPPNRQIMSTEQKPNVTQLIREIIASKLFMTPAEVDNDTKFTDLGIDSVLIVEVIKGINEAFGLSLRATLLYDYPTLNSLSEYLVAQYQLTEQSATPSISSEQPGQHYEVDFQDTPIHETLKESNNDRKSKSVEEPSVLIDKGEMSQRIAQPLREIIASKLFMAPGDVDDDTKFTDLGIDSVLIVEVIKGINEALGLSLRATILYDYPTLNSLSEYLVAQYQEQIALRVELPKEESLDLEEMNLVEESSKEALFHSSISNTEDDSLSPVEEKVEKTSLVTKDETKAVVINKPGEMSEVLKIEPVSIPEPSPNEVQIRVNAFSLNFGDLLCVRGLYPTMPDYPFTPGFEVAGEVIQIGTGITKMAIGDEVIALTSTQFGGQAEIVNTDAALVIQKPKSLSFEEGCALPIVFLTAYYSLYETAKLQAGERVLIQTAAGGVGLLAIQLAQAAGAEIFATVGSDDKITYLKQLGVPHVINYRKTDFFDQIKKITNGYGVDIVLNTLAGDAIQKGLNLLAPGGRYLEIAVTGLRAARQLDFSNLNDNQSFFSIDLKRLLINRPPNVTVYLEKMVEMLKKGQIQATLSKIFPFSKITQAYQHLQQRKNIGKVVVTLSSSMSEIEKKERLPVQKTTEAVRFEEKKEIPLIQKTTEAARLEDNDRNTVVQKHTSATSVGFEDIAIIGIAGRFPGAANLQQFWKNLQKGINSVIEVPKQRWDSQEYYDPDPQKPHKTVSKWGGFLDNIDCFDPLFFKISPKEAELMDPQQRLCLEESWKALEDAGYSGRRLSEKPIGVFIGVRSSDYRERMVSHQLDDDAYTLMGNDSAILAARISYYLNLKGPNLAVDTACSSSLVAIHLACQSLRAGESDMALAGGVGVITSPSFYLMSSKAGMLSPVGQCQTFDNSADGFVPGEGVGFVVLKPLKQARLDGDQIYGIIKGSGVNQDGKTNGITAPSSLSQIQLLQSIYRENNLSPNSISYVEAHGTGTKLGDPIEITALTDVFNQWNPRQQFCAIGSVKTNIGHSLAAAGVAGLLKILLSLKYQQIPPSLHFKTENEHIHFKDSPFYVNTTLTTWPTESNAPRRAAISSFGFSGTNCHIVIEEPERPLPLPTTKLSTAPQLLVLSAKNEERLQAYATDLRDFLDDDINETNLSLPNLAYTLQVGRDAMAERLAMIASNVDDFKYKLTQYVQGQTEIEAFYRGNVSRRIAESELLIDGEEGQEFLRIILKNNKLTKLAQLWVSGTEIDWQLLYPNQKPPRISLPTYPFARERYWIPASEPQLKVVGEPGKIARLHPLLGSNTSTLAEQQFTTKLTGNEFYLADHVVAEQKVLPGVAYLEMARAAGELAGTQPVMRLTNIVWAMPIMVSDRPVPVHISLYPNEQSVGFEVSTVDNNRVRQVHAQGKLNYGNSADFETVDIEAIQNRCAEIWDTAKCYQLFKTLDLNYGPSFQTLQVLHHNDREAFSRLQLPNGLTDGFNDFVWHPSLMDGALQTVMGLMGQTTTPYLPFALGEIELLGPLSKTCYAYVRQAEHSPTAGSAVKKFHISILDETGQVQVRLKDFSVRALKQPADETSNKIYYYQSRWEPSELDNRAGLFMSAGPILLFDTDDNRYSRFKKCFTSEVILVMPGESYQVLDPQTYSINPNHPADYRQLLAALTQQNSGLPSHIIHLWSQVPFVSEESALNAQIEMGLFSIFHLSQALLEQKPSGPIQLQYLYLETDDARQPQYAALSGFAKTICQENPKLSYQTVALPALDNVVEIVEAEFKTYELEVRYEKGQRWVKRLQEFDGVSETPTTSQLKEHGVYLITGGAGGLGLILAEYLAKHFKAKLVLTGRSELNKEQIQKIQSFNALGAEVIYLQADVSKRDEVEALIAQTKTRFHEINGIIHSAGVVKDALIVKKTLEEVATVLAPKVYGAVYLDEATQHEPLDFFVLFSSVAALMGNVGQSDYAYANAFMDNFAFWREEQRVSKKRVGKTLSINWPLWQQGGMRVDEQTEKWLAIRGIKALSTANGLEAFANGLSSTVSQFMIVEGHRQLIKQKMLEIESTAQQPIPGSTSKPIIHTNNSELMEKLQPDLLKVASTILNIQNMSLENGLSEYGFDSISFTDLSNRINEQYQLDITPAIFFEYPAIDTLSQFLSQKYQQSLLDYYQESLKSRAPVSEVTAEDTMVEETINVKTRFQPESVNAIVESQSRYNRPIAIIGMSGVMPQSDDLESFWQHLEAGDNLITEVPPDRWDWQAYYGDPSVEANKTKAKWGGFMHAVDKFDPLFFGISPREAELMDPQQRLFLETVWKTIEDAGYKTSKLSGTKTGVFVGVATGDYKELLVNHHQIEAYTVTGNTFSIVANRISYLFNWHGPSQAIDTACSSALVAIHRAVESISNGACEMAIAGGVNVMVSPTLTISFSNAGMLNEDGRCKTFDKRANGYVRGEGVGAILLKPLNTALADGDQIYAVIKGTDENHGGHATSLTAPNPNAQTQLLISVYEKAQIDPSTVSYIEAHGTGTPIGDPIEINGLKNAFAELYKKSGKSLPVEPHCGIGSVKTHIGHLETAAGIAGILKVLLAMKHKTLPGNLHFSELNPYIQLQDTPFYIVTENKTWTPLTDADGQKIPRRAGVNSFGFGGSNAHIVLEEYESKLPAIARASKQLLVLSAKNNERLKAYAQLVIVLLENQPDIQLPALAYTLQVGRDAMEERLAMVASSVDQLTEKLTQYVQEQAEIDDFYCGNIKTNQVQTERFIKGEAGETFLKVVIDKQELNQLAQLWVSGVEIDWQLLYPNQKPPRISLPTYPFARERYWIPASEPQLKVVGEPGKISRLLHPLLGSNTSTLAEQQFTTKLTGNEFYLADHVVAEQKVLPGVAYLEMARAAGELAGTQPVIRLTNIVWAMPIMVSDRPVPVHISLYPDEQSVEFEVSTVDNNRVRQVHAQGKLNYGNSADFETVDIEAIQNRCAEIWDTAKCYQLFKTIDLNYGPSFQTIQVLHHNDREALSLLQIPTALKDGLNDFVWHPSLMDGALQTVIGLMGQTTTPYLPFALGEIELLGPLSKTCYAYVRQAEHSPTAGSAVKKFHISILDETGQVQVRLKDFSVRALKQPADETSDKIYYYQSRWEPSELDNRAGLFMSAGPILLFDTDDNRYSRFKKCFTSEVILVMPGESYQVLAPQTYSINPNHPADYRQLLAALTQQNSGLPSHIIHLWSQVPFVNEEAALNAQIEMGLFSIFHLSQALLEQKPSEPIQLQYVYLETDDARQPQYAALSGFAKTICQENPKLSYQTVALPALDNVVEIVEAEFQTYELEVRYEKCQRWVKRLQEFDGASETPTTSQLKEHGVYLITGGAGGLGLILAEYLAKHFKAKLVLTGRSELNKEQIQKIQSFNALGAEVIYLQTDVSKRDEVGTLIAKTKSHFHEINGIIHSAGVVKDALIVKKTPEEVATVLAPKVYGTVYLDEATQNEPLDFLVLFSSASAVMGNVGQSDYAYANAFMDNFAFWREEQRVSKKRVGKTRSINWPLWREGGMKVDEETEIWIEKRMGLVAIQTEEGLNAFKKALTLDTEQVTIISGEKAKVNAYLNTLSFGRPDSAKQALKNATKSVPFSKPDLTEKVEKSLLQLCSELLKVKEPDLDIETDFGDYGMDSIMMMSMLNRIEATYGSAIEPNAIAEYPTIKLMASYLIEQDIVKVETESDPAIPTKSGTSTLELNQPQENSLVPKPSATRTRFIQPLSNQGISKIAVISMAGRFPGASNLDSFWENLMNGKKSITEVPEERWKISDYYTSDKNVPNKTYSKWGGYIEDIDRFDAAYFGISDTDALVMDPQHRILLELTQELLDRAGYRKEELDDHRVGVFIGGAESAYVKNHLDKIPEDCRNIIVNTIQNMMAARISDYYNLTGPSLTTDTACSSSLVSIHQACQSLMQGESELAIAGGIELLIDPFIHIAFSKAGVLSDENKSYIFDQRAKGMVLGEGAGLVLLKPFEKAIAAGDQILGVINGSAVNNDGHTMGLTVPNLEGQKAVITEAIEKSGVDPATITYLEAHGTGTLLGDPIEIKAITQVYRAFTQDKQYCAVGSVKSNIGHLLHAAGIASFIKVLLALQHHQIPPTLNCEKPHPRFNFEESPCYPITQPTQWMPNNGLRCAAISSFGFGGTNCHLIVEAFSESKHRHYVQKRASAPPTQFNRKRYWLGKEIVEASHQPVDVAFYQEILTKLSQGKLTVEQAKQLENNRIL